MEIDAFLFDLDGVITDSSTAHFKAWKAVANSYGIDLPDSLEVSLKGISRRNSVEKIVQYANIDLSEDAKQAFMDTKNAMYQDLVAEYNPDNLLPGVQTILEFARAHSIKIGLVSASKNAVPLIEALKIKAFFDVIVDPAKHPSKPAPDLFLAAAKRLGVAPENCVAFEDAIAGVQAIKAAGMTAIGIGERLDADYVFADLTAAHAMLETHV